MWGCYLTRYSTMDTFKLYAIPKLWKTQGRKGQQKVISLKQKLSLNNTEIDSLIPIHYKFDTLGN